MDKEFQQLLGNLVKQALNEDVGNGDVTTIATIPKEQQSTATFIVKESCIIAGVELATLICKEVDSGLICKWFNQDGDQIKNQKEIGIIEGSTWSILMSERLLLNCMQRMSGVATKTANLVEMIYPYGTKLLDTRKTTPNNRILEKWAVKIGGGVNHRMGLYDQILIKDNHIAASGGIENALQNCEKYIVEKKLDVPIIVEVKDMDEFKKVVDFSMVSRVLLDNFSPEDIIAIVSFNNGRKLLEASGGIDEKNIVDFAKTGVDYISVGSITHHIESIDISLKIN
jgi:nicotinate-nucleotide pyrophosphorylase (carboxylating)